MIFASDRPLFHDLADPLRSRMFASGFLSMAFTAENLTLGNLFSDPIPTPRPDPMADLLRWVLVVKLEILMRSAPYAGTILCEPLRSPAGHPLSLVLTLLFGVPVAHVARGYT